MTGVQTCAHHTFPSENDSRTVGETELMAVFLPAASLRMLLFDRDGRVYNEVSDVQGISLRWFLPAFLDKHVNKNYRLTDRNRVVKASYHMNNHRICIHDEEGKRLAQTEKTSGEKGDLVYRINGETEIAVSYSSLYTDYQFYKGERRMARFRKGILPIEYAQIFKDANIPVLSFEKEITMDERIIIIAILTQLLRYTSH